MTSDATDPRPTPVAKQPWWVAMPSLRVAVVLTALWGGLFVYSLIVLLGEFSLWQLFWVILSGLQVVIYGPSIFYHARARRQLRE